MTVAQVETRSRRWLIVVGVAAVLTIGSLIASAVAAVHARTDARVLTSPRANPLALEFAPPDETATWIWLAAAAVFLVVVVVGLVGRARSLRTAATR